MVITETSIRPYPHREAQAPGKEEVEGKGPDIPVRLPRTTKGEVVEEEGNPSQMLQQSLKQSFHVGIPEEGINLKKMVECFEKELLLEALEKTGWVKNKAANLLGLNRTTLVEKLKKMQITNPEG